MPVKFMRDTRYANSEIEMQQPPGFRPRASGMSVSRFFDSTRDCDCSVCVHYTEKKKCNSSTGCVCLQERLAAGCVPLAELLAMLAAEVATPPFVSRVAQLSKQSCTTFRDKAHKQRFADAQQRQLAGSLPQMVAVYLLTADARLWEKAQKSITSERIHFHAVEIHGIDLDGYVLFHAARDLYRGTKHISLSELTDPELVSDELFALIVIAFLLIRYGATVLSTERS